MVSLTKEVFTNFFSNDMDIISNDAKKLLSDETNRRAYLDGIENLREQEYAGEKHPRVTITLKDNSKLTLTR